ncbi:MAG TPA: response regulator transcription factor [Acidimicrobiales bacterium]|nr:response regulator transcription factor [Acidimicrobiales bacterium]
MSRLFVIDPDPDDRRAIVAALRHYGYEVEVVRSDAVIAVLRRRRPHAIVIDPVECGPVAWLQLLRAQTDVPVIVVSCCDDPNEQIDALDAGADDYLVKPVNPEALRARLRASLRRVPDTNGAGAVISTEDFVVSLSDRRWFRSDGAEAHLTPVEWRIVELLVQRAGHLVTHAELLTGVWGSAEHSADTIRVHLAAIRRKVEPEPSHPRYFITAPGLGLRFEAALEASAQSC